LWFTTKKKKLNDKEGVILLVALIPLDMGCCKISALYKLSH